MTSVFPSGGCLGAIILQTGLAVGSGYSHLDRVFLTVVNQGNRPVGSLDAIHGHTRLAIPSARLQDGDVIDYLSVPVATGTQFKINTNFSLLPAPFMSFLDDPGNFLFIPLIRFAADVS